MSPAPVYGKENSNDTSSSSQPASTSNSRTTRDSNVLPNSSRSVAGPAIQSQNSAGSLVNGTANDAVQTFTKATAGDFVAKNKLQAGLGRSGWHLALKSALGTLQKGKIPLLLAVEAGNQSMCRELLGQQTAEQLKATTDNGDAAIHIAARRRDVDMIRILVDYGTNVDMQNVSMLIKDLI